MPVSTNAGLFRPITITAPLGSLANPRFPAPTIARFCPGNIVADTRDARAGPGHARIAWPPASATSRWWPSRGDDRAWVYMDIIEGSYGGS